MTKIKFALFILSIFTLIACDGPKQPEFIKLEQVKFGSLSLGNEPSVLLTGNALFHNPNPVGAKISRMDLDVFIEERKLANINQKISSKMQANADFKLPLNARIPVKELYKDLKGGIKNIFKKFEVNYAVKGSITVDFAGVNIKVPIDYQDKELIRF